MYSPHLVHSAPISLALILSLALGCAADKTTECAPPEDAPPSAAPHPAAPHPVVDAAAVEDLQTAFKHAIEAAGPAVVSVHSTKTVTSTGQMLPFGDPLFERFFAPQRPQSHEFRAEGHGSGFIIDAKGHILTNSHVVEGAEEIRVQLADEREFDAQVIGADPPTDLALLKIEAEDLTPVEFGDSDTLTVGDWVLAIGNPFNLPRTVSAGIVSATGRANIGIVDYENFIQTDAAVNPGNSGGPLVDLAGQVVGINTAIASRTGANNGIAFAVPINMAKEVVAQLLDKGQVVRGYLGIMISELTPRLAQSFNHEGESGILVQDVSEGSAAEQAGLQPGDIITKLEGEEVTSVPEFRRAIARQAPGTKISLEVWRKGKFVEVRANLGETPRSARAQAGDDRPPTELGIELQDLTPRLRQQLGIEEEGGGAVITSVEPGSAAARAGLRPGDVIEEIGREQVDGAAKAVELLREADLEHGVRLRVSRGGRGRYVIIETN